MLRKYTSRELILSGLADLLQAENIEKITVRKIVDYCGITAPCFYNYFKDKNEVVNTIFIEKVTPYISLSLGEWHEQTTKLYLEDSAFFRHTIYYEGQNNLLQTIYEVVFRKYLLHIKESVFENPMLEKTIRQALSSMIYGYIGLLKETYDGNFGISEKEFFENYHSVWELMEQWVPSILKEYLSEFPLREPDCHFFDNLK